MLDPRKLAALQALLTCKTFRSACEQADVTETTLRKWMQEDTEFRSELEKQMASVLDYTADTLKKAVARSAEVLLDQLDSDDADKQMEIADKTFEIMTKFMQTHALLKRIEQLECQTGSNPEAPTA